MRPLEDQFQSDFILCSGGCNGIKVVWVIGRRSSLAEEDIHKINNSTVIREEHVLSCCSTAETWLNDNKEAFQYDVLMW